MINCIFEYYNKFGNRDYIGEEVSQIEHMTQSAMLAENDNQSVEVILACFFHDIGHLIEFNETMGNYGTKNHEKIGANFLRKHGFKYPIPELVENHVKAKRYLTYKNKDYYKNLSHASQETLIHQGGKMSDKEAKEFESDTLFKLSLKMREYDEKAKVKNKKIKSLEFYKNLSKDYLKSLPI
jgi:putative nucleotidyltransferase with HDIG domain